MFGYFLADPQTLSAEDKKRYRAWYCGLCEALRDGYGTAARATLNFEATFLTILLSSAYGLDETQSKGRCFVHPAVRHEAIRTEASDYSADINVLLSYWKCADDWNDDKSVKARLEGRVLEKHFLKSSQKHPDFSAKAQKALDELTELEKKGIIDPDKTSRIFGELTGAVFAWKKDPLEEELFRLGETLGRFLYVLDACCDLSSDIKKERYNPMISVPESDFMPYLKMLAGDMDEAFRALPLKKDLPILNNIVYSGVWLKYDIKTAKKQRSDR